MKAKKHKLEASLDFNFFLLGIASSETDFKLCWRINQVCNIDLKREENLNVFNKKHNIEQNFSLYSDTNTLYQGFLIANKSQDGYLVEELKNIDFFIKISTEEISIFDDLYLNVKELEQVQAIFKLDPNSLKSKHKLIF